MKNRNIVEISKKGQLLIPKSYRERSGIKPGSTVALEAGDKKLTIHVLPEDPLDAACGILSGRPSLAEKLLEERGAENEIEEKKIRS